MGSGRGFSTIFLEVQGHHPEDSMFNLNHISEILPFPNIPDSTLVEEGFVRRERARHHTFDSTYRENVLYSWKSFLFCVLCHHGTPQALLRIQFA